jgi:hypothetical protein
MSISLLVGGHPLTDHNHCMDMVVINDLLHTTLKFVIPWIRNPLLDGSILWAAHIYDKSMTLP